jgi:hypothetical protein
MENDWAAKSTCWVVGMTDSCMHLEFEEVN